MAERDQAGAPGGGDAAASSGGPREDALMARLRPGGAGSSEPPQPMTCLVGILGKSARAGYWTLYLGLDMTRRAEIREEDILFSEPLAADQSPFGSMGGTRVCVKRGATVDYARTLSQQMPAEAVGGGEFDLDVRLGAAGRGRINMAAPQIPATQDTQCCFPDTFGTECGGGTGAGNTCLTCVSCGDTCFRTCRDTCRTQCDTCPGDTCLRTCADTCHTQCATCAPGTCQTCQTHCGTCQTCVTCQTCQTCQTQCATQCGTCHTCQTQCVACPRTEQTCPGDTCRACTHVTCFNTCGC